MNYQYINTVIGEVYRDLECEPQPFTATGSVKALGARSESGWNQSLISYFNAGSENRIVPCIAIKQVKARKSIAEAYFVQARGWVWDTDYMLDHFDSILCTGFYSEEELDAFAEAGKPVPDSDTARPENYPLPAVDTEAMKAVLFGIYRKWFTNSVPVKIAVPADCDYDSYVIGAARAVYSYLPVYLRGVFGFTSYMVNPLPGISFSFVPERRADANTVFLDGSRNNAIAERIKRGSGFSDVDTFVLHLLELDEKARKEYLSAVCQDFEGAVPVDKKAYMQAGSMESLLSDNAGQNVMYARWMRHFAKEAENATAVGQRVREEIKQKIVPEDFGSYLQTQLAQKNTVDEVMAAVAGYAPLCSEIPELCDEVAQTIYDKLVLLGLSKDAAFLELKKVAPGMNGMVSEGFLSKIFREELLQPREEQLRTKRPDRAGAFEEIAAEANKLKELARDNMRAAEAEAYGREMDAFIAESRSLEAERRYHTLPTGFDAAEVQNGESNAAAAGILAFLGDGADKEQSVPLRDKLEQYIAEHRISAAESAFEQIKGKAPETQEACDAVLNHAHEIEARLSGIQDMPAAKELTSAIEKHCTETRLGFAKHSFALLKTVAPKNMETCTATVAEAHKIEAFVSSLTGNEEAEQLMADIRRFCENARIAAAKSELETLKGTEPQGLKECDAKLDHAKAVIDYISGDLGNAEAAELTENIRSYRTETRLACARKVLGKLQATQPKGFAGCEETIAAAGEIKAFALVLQDNAEAAALGEEIEKFCHTARLSTAKRELEVLRSRQITGYQASDAAIARAGEIKTFASVLGEESGELNSELDAYCTACRVKESERSLAELKRRTADSEEACEQVIKDADALLSFAALIPAWDGAEQLQQDAVAIKQKMEERKKTIYVEGKRREFKKIEAGEYTERADITAAQDKARDVLSSLTENAGERPEAAPVKAAIEAFVERFQNKLDTEATAAEMIQAALADPGKDYFTVLELIEAKYDSIAADRTTLIAALRAAKRPASFEAYEAAFKKHYGAMTLKNITAHYPTLAGVIAQDVSNCVISTKLAEGSAAQLRSKIDRANALAEFIGTGSKFVLNDSEVKNIELLHKALGLEVATGNASEMKRVDYLLENGVYSAAELLRICEIAGEDSAATQALVTYLLQNGIANGDEKTYLNAYDVLGRHGNEEALLAMEDNDSAAGTALGIWKQERKKAKKPSLLIPLIAVGVFSVVLLAATGVFAFLFIQKSDAVTQYHNSTARYEQRIGELESEITALQNAAVTPQQPAVVLPKYVLETAFAAYNHEAALQSINGYSVDKQEALSTLYSKYAAQYAAQVEDTQAAEAVTWDEYYYWTVWVMAGKAECGELVEATEANFLAAAKDAAKLLAIIHADLADSIPVLTAAEAGAEPETAFSPVDILTLDYSTIQEAYDAYSTPETPEN